MIFNEKKSEKNACKSYPHNKDNMIYTLYKSYSLIIHFFRVIHIAFCGKLWLVLEKSKYSKYKKIIFILKKYSDII